MSRTAKVLELAQSLDSVNYYQLLGIERNASSEKVTDRYYFLAANLHPDKFVHTGDARQIKALNKIGARLGEARKVLTNPSARKKYDQALDDGQLRLLPNEREPKKKQITQDPAHPLARQLFEQAEKLLTAGDREAARPKLKLASQYERGSKAIATLMASLDPKIEEKTEEIAAQEKPKPPPPTAAPLVSEPAPSADAASKKPGMPTQSTPVATQTKATGIPEKAVRAEKRVPIQLAVKLKLPSWDRVEKLVSRDLSCGGIFLPSRKKPKVGSQIRLAFVLPNEEVVDLSAEVARVVEDGDNAGFGVNFHEVSADVLSGLKRLVEKHAAGGQTAKPLKPPANDAALESVKFRSSHEVMPPTPRMTGAKMKSRRLLTVDVLSPVLGSEDTAEQFVELLTIGEHADAMRILLERLEPGTSQRILRAVIHLVEGLQSKRKGEVDVAKEHFQKALELDSACHEAVMLLRNS